MITAIFIAYWRDFRNIRSNYRGLKTINLVSNLLLWIAMGLLVYSFSVMDYEMIAVYENVDNNMSLFDRIMATWASRPGAMLLWAFFQSIFTVVSVHKLADEGSTEFEKRVISALLFFNFLIMSFAISARPGPFETHEAVYANGLGLTPSLRNFWQQLHPPLAFLSYSALIVPYAIGFIALQKDSETIISDRVKWLMDFFMMTGWVFSTLFILAGAIWSYEVDWGGLWLWDPVQVSSFILWILSSVYFHLKPLLHKDATIHYFGATLGWVGVTLAAFVVRGGLIDGPHQYISTAQLVVFTLLLLGTILGVIYSLQKAESDVIPDWLFSLPTGGNRFSVYTIWVLIITVLVNLTSLSLNIIYFQLELPLRDLSSYYGMINGILMTILGFLLILCESETLRVASNSFFGILISSIILAFVIHLFALPSFSFVPFLLLVLMTGFTIMQVVQIGYTFYSGKVHRIPVRLIHLVILLTLLSFFATDPQTTTQQYSLEMDQNQTIESVGVGLVYTQIDRESDISILVNVLSKSGEKIGELTLKQGIYQGQPWSLGDWIINPSYDIYVKLASIDYSLYSGDSPQISVLVKIVPWVNLFRLNLGITTIIGTMGIFSRFRTRNNNIRRNIKRSSSTNSGKIDEMK